MDSCLVVSGDVLALRSLGVSASLVFCEILARIVSLNSSGLALSMIVLISVFWVVFASACGASMLACGASGAEARVSAAISLAVKISSIPDE